ncbi:MAG: tetratricopeptide repeat protein [Myxococcaceae bacterium]|nr:tetratricopeptide repeat protein [Myxococcaceae bacterium]
MDAVAQLDLLWKTRDEPAAIKATDAAISAGLKANPDDYQVLWRAARFRWWQADGTVEGQEKLKKQLGKEAWNLADRALKVKSDGMEAHYYVALGVGAYSQAVGVLTALSEGLEGKFVENLDYAIKANEAFDTAGPHRAKGRYHWELPWPKRDLAKSKSELEAAIKLSPQHLRNYYYLADTYLKDGNAKEAKVQITKVLTGNGDWDPPEARRVKAWAKTLSTKIDEELK